MLRYVTRGLKIGVQSRFDPKFDVGIRTFFPENFGQAYCTVCGDKQSLDPHVGTLGQTVTVHQFFKPSSSISYPVTRAPKLAVLRLF